MRIKVKGKDYSCCGRNENERLDEYFEGCFSGGREELKAIEEGFIFLIERAKLNAEEIAELKYVITTGERYGRDEIEIVEE